MYILCDIGPLSLCSIIFFDVLDFILCLVNRFLRFCLLNGGREKSGKWLVTVLEIDYN